LCSQFGLRFFKDLIRNVEEVIHARREDKRGPPREAGTGSLPNPKPCNKAACHESAGRQFKPRKKGQSKTELVLNHLVDGMREAGAEVAHFIGGRKPSATASGAFPAGRNPPAWALTRTT
jgi:hypothetical protein